MLSTAWWSVVEKTLVYWPLFPDLFQVKQEIPDTLKININQIKSNPSCNPDSSHRLEQSKEVAIEEHGLEVPWILFEGTAD